MSEFKVPRLVTVLEHCNRPAPVNVIFPLVASNAASASYIPVLLIESVPSISEDPLALKVPVLIEVVPSILLVPVMVAVVAASAKVADDCTVKFPAAVIVPWDVLVPD